MRTTVEGGRSPPQHCASEFQRREKLVSSESIFLISAGEIERALETINLGLSKTEFLDAEAFLLRSQIYFFQKKYNLALQDVARCIELKPDNGWAWFHKGIVYAYLNKPEEACFCWSKAKDAGIQKVETYIRYQCF